jgi:hypothetical protein
MPSDLASKVVDDWTEEDIMEARRRRVPEAVRLAQALKTRFVPTREGWTRPLLRGWPHLASCKPEQIKAWAKDRISWGSYRQFVAVSSPRSSIFDIDDLPAAESMGFDMGWVRNCYTVRTPSSGFHVYPPWDEAFGNLPLQNVLEVKGPQGEPVFEWKIGGSPAAAPWSMRSSDHGTPGFYVPIQPVMGPASDPKALVEWALSRSKAREWRKPATLKWEWDPTFDIDDFMEHFGTSYCAECKDYSDPNVLLVAPEESPCCDRDACPDGNARAAKAKFFFDGLSSYGYVCHRCGATRHDLEEKFGRWKGPIYLGDTDDGIVELGRRIGMHIINVTGEARKPIWKR